MSRPYYLESLKLRRELGDQAGTAACLEGLAALAAQAGRPHDAVRLVGAAAALRSAIGAPHSPIDAPDYQRMVEAIRALLGEIDFARAWTDGQTMSSQQIVMAMLDTDNDQHL